MGPRNAWKRTSIQVAIAAIAKPTTSFVVQLHFGVWFDSGCSSVCVFLGFNVERSQFIRIVDHPCNIYYRLQI